MTSDTEFRDYLNELKASIDIVKVVDADEPLMQRGRDWRGVHHDSLQVSPDTGLWNWHARGVGGDAVRWLEWRRGLSFKAALEEAARLAGKEPPDWGNAAGRGMLAASARADAFEVACGFFQRKLAASEAALRYCCEKRGWTPETVKAARLGFFDGDYDGLRQELAGKDVDVTTPAAVALVGWRGDVRAWAEKHEVAPAPRWVEQGWIGGLPKGMLVYPHVEWGRVRYFSARSAATMCQEGEEFVVWEALTDMETRYTSEDEARRAGKRHHNLPRELVGDRRVFWNGEATPGKGNLVVVEGQADAITLAQWGIPAVALAGCGLDNTDAGRRITATLHRHTEEGVVHVALDDDAAGQKAWQSVAGALDGRVFVIRWPAPAKDANDWLLAGGTAEQMKALLQEAEHYIEWLAAAAGEAPEPEKPAAIERLATAFRRLTAATQAVFRKRVAKLAGIPTGQLDKLVQAAEKEDQEKDERPPDIICAVGGTLGEALLETLYIPPNGNDNHSMLLLAGKTRFALRASGSPSQVVDFYDYGDKRFTPSAETEMMRKMTVRFASYVGEAMETRALVRKVQALIHKYVDVDVFYETLSAYYVLFTWVYDVFDTLPYLRIKGDTGTGKSRFLQVVGSLCFRPILMNAGASIPSLFRTMHQYQGTLVLDEGDFQESDEASMIAKILNVGYQRWQGYIHRSGDKEKDFATDMFVVYGPKIIGTRRAFNDRAIESRCLTKETTSPTMRADLPVELPAMFWTEEVPEMQALLLRFRLDNWSPALLKREVVLDDYIEPRLRQVITPLMRMVDDPDLQEDLRVFMREYNDQLMADRGSTIESKVLEALYITWQTYETAKTPAEERDYSFGPLAAIANDLLDFENGTPINRWVRYAQREKGKKASFQITAKGVSEIVKRTFGLRTERRKAVDRRAQITWDMERIESFWRRYGLASKDSRVDLLQLYQHIEARRDEYEKKLNNE
jgi:DNA primase